MTIPQELSAALSGRYRIEREVGRGGMATVYLASDLRHERPVALKVLNPELGAVLGVERFLSEIRVTANLQHPNLLPLFDSGEAEGLLFYVMPYVEGESLRHRLEREKQLPVDEAVRIAVAAANALDYAHGHGVVHRDLKPENILLQHGQPVIADFGIALAVSNAGGGRITQTGLSLGTPQYMSPEQATGDRVIDGRADIYSLAAVLYEMLTGEPPHVGNTAQAIIAKLMTEEVRPVTVLRRAVPDYVDVAIQRALQKLPADRFATGAQFADALVTARAPTTTSMSAATMNKRSARVVVPWAVAAVAVGFGAWMSARRGVVVPPLAAHFTMKIDPSVQLDASQSEIAVAPDGSRIVFSALQNGLTQFFVRSLGDDEARSVPGTEFGVGPVVSHDGAWIGFTQLGQLKRAPLAGGPVRTIAASGGALGAWSANDVIVVSRGGRTPGLFTVPATGGEPKRLTTPDTALGELRHVQPKSLPGGSGVVFAVGNGQVGQQKIAVTTMDGRVTRLDLIGLSPFFVAPNHLVITRPDGVVQAVPFDVDKLRVTGPPVTILENVFVRNNQALIAGAMDGSLVAYFRGGQSERIGLLSPTGAMLVLPGEARRFRHPRVSPDGSSIAVDIIAPDGTRDVFIYDVKTSATRKLTLDGRASDAAWSSDGKRIAFTRRDSAGTEGHVFSVAADGSDAPRLLVGGPGAQYPAFWSHDGKTFYYDELVPPRPTVMKALKADGTTEVIAESKTAVLRLPALSPDGRWLAYTSNETQRVEVFVRPLTGDGKWQVSAQGGTQPVWSRDGKTLYYRADRHIIAATIGSGPAFSVTDRRPVAEDHFAFENTINYDAMADGRLVVLVPVDEGLQLNVIVNWAEELAKRTSTSAPAR